VPAPTPPVTRRMVAVQQPGHADHAALAAPGDIEPKVSAATAGGASSAAVLLPFVLWLLSEYVFAGPVPIPVQGFTGLVITGACTFAAGYYARHVDRAPRVH
jgi:hypothetical protein